MTLIIVLTVLAAVLILVLRLGRRSGVTAQDLLRELPGDDIIARPRIRADRATIINAPASEVWPWIVQLGRGRAGWYAPSWLERILVWDPKRRGLRTIVSTFQTPRVGDIEPDWGPGKLEVLAIETGKSLVYGSVMPKDSKGDYLFSWSHILEPIDDVSCRYYIRMRVRPIKRPLMRVGMVFGGLFDWITIVVMFAGLKDNLKRR